MTARRLGLCLLLLAVACDGQPAEPQQAATPPPPALPERTTVSEAPAQVTSRVTVGASAPVVSQVHVGQAPTSELSSVEVEVAEVLSDFDARTTGGGTLLTVPDRVLFAFDSARLKPGAARSLDRIAKVIDYYRRAPVQIRGHTDAVGSAAYNQSLSERRAQAVARYFVREHGVAPRRLTAVGFGERRPVAPNTRGGRDNPQGRRRNRRVEVFVEGVTQTP